MPQTIHDFDVRRIDGKPASLSEFKGKVLLVVNVASECGLTPQYTGLETIYERYHDRGLEILGFPANEFGAQEPGSNAEIQEFCRTQFGVKFPMFEKIVVKGEGKHPLYTYLTQTRKTSLGKEGSDLYQRLEAKGMGPKEEGDILWNFEKFLINRQGEVVARFAPTVTPEDPQLTQALEAELAKA